MRNLWIVILLLLFSCTTEQSQKPHPNIVLLLADDLGYGDVGYNGQEMIQTPNIDSLAQEGLVFTDFYAGAPVCGPSRSVLMTGMHTGHTTIRGNMTMQGGKAGKKGNRIVYRANLQKDDLTIGNIMQQAGYTTGMVGKWHLGGYDSAATPLHRGFDEFSGWLVNLPETYASTYWPEKRFVNGVVEDISENQGGKKGYYHTDICTDEAISFLEKHENDEQPFMLFVNYSNPHAPLDAPDQAIFTNKDWPDDMKTYAAMIYYLDRSVARIKQRLVETGLSENTILIFTSDNGPRSNYSDRLTEVVDFFNSNGDLRGYKRDLYEGGIRVPMVAWSPKMIDKGVISSPYYFTDMMATFRDIAGGQFELVTDGVSFYSEIIERNRAVDPRYLYWEFFENGFEQAIRYDRWKGIKRNGEYELYDLATDIGESRNVVNDHPEVIQAMEKYLSACRTESPYWKTPTK